MFFKKKIIRKYREKLTKIRLRNNLKILNQKQEFSKILNHDVKTALLAQSSCLELLLKNSFGEITPEQKDIVKQILSSNNFLVEIINNAIYLAEFEQKTSNLQFEDVDIVNQAQLCLDNVKSLAKNKEQKIILKAKNDKIKLNADKNLIHKIISNILTSSVSYGFEGSNIVVLIEENKNEILFSAKNKSVYMTKEKIDDIFGNSKSSADFNQLGMKLNLNIAKKLINAQNWDFVVKSDEKDNSSTIGFIAKKS